MLAMILERRRARLRALPLPQSWRDLIDQRVPHVGRMPRDLRWQLEMHVRVFVAEKRFVGVDGLEVTDEMRVVIAANACLLALNRGSEVFPKVRRILIYPDRPLRETSRGSVAVGWSQVAHRLPGLNPVIHEFAGHLGTGPAESEAFFEDPGSMAVLHASLYQELRRLYRVDPAHWSPSRRLAPAIRAATQVDSTTAGGLRSVTG
ncbi:MAG TPA: zinc-dependent peptidase [Usitatibacter sp.]|nr:zinc-dependent peptidase [Usitatibacter sp.]